MRVRHQETKTNPKGFTARVFPVRCLERSRRSNTGVCSVLPPAGAIAPGDLAPELMTLSPGLGAAGRSVAQTPAPCLQDSPGTVPELTPWEGSVLAHSAAFLTLNIAGEASSQKTLK